MSQHPPSDVAFTPAVKAEQERRGSRAAYARMEEGEGWETRVTPDLAAFLAERDSLYLGTASAAGQPYIQHRGGPPGFVRALDEATLGFADLGGNRQYITLGNLAENDRAFLFFMDYERRRRVKVWGRARVVEGDADLLARLAPGGAAARAERAIVFHVEAWDVNCPKHIPQKLDAAAVKAALDEKDRRIRALEAENGRLRAELRREEPRRSTGR
jgi:predicted pyridoxine 5'-phosphate oxidase superfamily flavin-nucleotide-binding protein